MMHPRLFATGLGALLLAATPALAAEEWEVILQQALASPYSKTRHNGVKQIDTDTEKGLKTLWKVLAIEDPDKVDWYVREGAYEAILRAQSPEALAEIDSVLAGKGNERAKEAIVYAVIWKLRKQFVKSEGGNDDELIEDAKFRLRKTRGPDYFKLVLPTIKAVDPDGKLFERILTAYQDDSERVRCAALTAFQAYPDERALPLLFDSLEKNQKKQKKLYKEWVLTRFALEQLTGQRFREDVDKWLAWWKNEQTDFTIAKRVEEAEDEEGKLTTRVRDPDSPVEVDFDTTMVRGNKDGYPLLVLPWRQYEPDYFRPYFHGIEEECLVYYVKLPKVGDFKGLQRDATSNLVNYPLDILARALIQLMAEQKLERFGVLGHGPEASTLAMKVAAANPDKVSHLILINPRSAGARFGEAIEEVIQLGKRRRSREIEKGGESILIDETTGNPIYQAADSDEGAGLGRALQALRFADATSPEVGQFRYLFEDGDSAQTLADNEWRAQTFFDGKPRVEAMVIMGLLDPWTPQGDMTRVAGIFNRPAVVKFDRASEFPFMSETLQFNLAVRKFLKKANKSLQASQKKK